MSALWLRALCVACALCACNGQLASDPAPSDPAAPASPGSSASAADPASPAKPSTDPTAVECNGQPCAPPNQCVRYSGIAGPRVPLYACGIPCAPDGACPSPMSCRVIADGPRLCQ